MPEQFVTRLNLQPGLPETVRAYSVTGDGVTDDYNALREVAAKFGTTGHIYFPAGTYRVGTNLTFNCLCEFAPGATFDPDSGVTVTLAGPIRTAPGSSIIAAGTTGMVSITGPMDAGSGVINVKAFGAVGDGVTDDTAALLAAFTLARDTGIPIELSGSFLVSGPVLPNAQVATGSLHVICLGDVAFTVSGSATPFWTLIYLYTIAANDVTFTGGSLTIDLNNKAATGVYLRHIAATQSGSVSLRTPITVLNARNTYTTGSFSTQDNGGFVVFGDYASVVIDEPRVVGVTRDGTDGVCRGIVVADYSGVVSIRKPYIENILTGAGAADADGIAVAGAVPSGGDIFTSKRLGRSVIIEPTLVDCQGRSIKSQCSDTTVIAPKVIRQNVVSIASAVDFDFQRGNGLLMSPTLAYLKDGATSPLGSSFSVIGFQNPLADCEAVSRCENLSLVSEVQLSRIATAVYRSGALSSSVVVDGVNIQAAGGLTDTVVTRAIVEIPNTETTVATLSGIATVIVRNVRGPIGYSASGGTDKEGAGAIGYTGYTSASIASKLAFEVSNVHNTMPVGSFNWTFFNLSGSKITALDSWVMRDCQNIRQLLWTFSGPLDSFDFATLKNGNTFTADLTAIGTVANAPPWETGSGSNALVEVIADSTIRVTTSGGGVRPEVWMTYDKATTWRRLGSDAPTTKTADFSVLANEDVFINNKSGSACVVTLPSASVFVGRTIRIRTIQAEAVNSASSNVVPLIGGAAGTAILAATAGRWADLTSDGANWIVMAAN